MRSIPLIRTLAVILVVLAIVTGLSWIRLRASSEPLVQEVVAGAFTPLDALQGNAVPALEVAETFDETQSDLSLSAEFRQAEYDRAIELVREGSPLADFLTATYNSNSPGRWQSAKRLVALYEEMMSSPEDAHTSLPLAAEGQRILQADPTMAGSILWPIECRRAMCIVQISETPNPPPGQGGGSAGFLKAIMSWGGMEITSDGEFANDPNQFGFGEVRVIHGSEQTFVFLRRKVDESPSLQ